MKSYLLLFVLLIFGFNGFTQPEENFNSRCPSCYTPRIKPPRMAPSLSSILSFNKLEKTDWSVPGGESAFESIFLLDYMPSQFSVFAFKPGTLNLKYKNSFTVDLHVCPFKEDSLAKYEKSNINLTMKEPLRQYQEFHETFDDYFDVFLETYSPNLISFLDHFEYKPYREQEAILDSLDVNDIDLNDYIADKIREKYQIASDDPGPVLDAFDQFLKSEYASSLGYLHKLATKGIYNIGVSMCALVVSTDILALWNYQEQKPYLEQGKRVASPIRLSSLNYSNMEYFGERAYDNCGHHSEIAGTGINLFFTEYYHLRIIDISHLQQENKLSQFYILQSKDKFDNYELNDFIDEAFIKASRIFYNVPFSNDYLVFSKGFIFLNNHYVFLGAGIDCLRTKNDKIVFVTLKNKKQIELNLTKFKKALLKSGLDHVYVEIVGNKLMLYAVKDNSKK